MINNNSLDVFMIDNEPLAPTSVKTEVGKHQISIINKKYHKNYDENINIESGSIYNVKFEYNLKTYTPLYTSLIIPGLGQLRDGAKQKETIIMAANFLSAGLALWSSNGYNKQNKIYSEKIELYRNETDEFRIFERKKELQSAYDDAKSFLLLRNISIGAFIASYVYNAVDACWNHSTDGHFVISPAISKNKTSSISVRVTF